MEKWLNRILLIIITPVVLYYGAIFSAVVYLGIKDGQAYDACVESQIVLGNSQQDSMEQCL